MKKIKITGKMWNEITAIQDRLVLLHNGLEDKPLYLTWHLAPYIGLFDATLYDLDEDGNIKGRLDGFTCYVDGDWDECHTLGYAIDKINELEEKYGLE